MNLRYRVSQRNYYPSCGTCGAIGHSTRQCPLRRLQEKQEALGPARPQPQQHEVDAALTSVEKATLDESIRQLREKWGIKEKGDASSNSHHE